MVGLVAGVPGVDRRWTFAEMLAEAERVARGAARPASRPASASRCGRRTSRSGCCSSSAPRWRVSCSSRSTRRTSVTSWRTCSVSRARRAWCSCDEWRGNPMRASLDAVRGDLEQLREVVMFDEWDAFLASAGRTCPARRSARRSGADPVHVGHDRLPEGRVAAPRRADRQRRAVRGGGRDRPGRRYVNPMPMFHTAGCVLGALGTLHARAAHVPVLAFDPGVRARAHRTRTGHRDARRSHHADRAAGAPRPRDARPVESAVGGVGWQPRPRRARPAHRATSASSSASCTARPSARRSSR